MKIAILILALTLPSQAWNGTGHRVIAALAYDALTPATRARVDDLIRRHPDYQLFLRGAPSGNSAARARAAFIGASVWADQIKSDPRFYDDDRRNARPTRLLPGFPDMGRHQNWHFVNLPFTQDGTRLRDARVPHIVTEIGRLTRALARPIGDSANPVYALPWIVHLVGDIHNPLHAATRFTRDDPGGDRGGNAVYVEPGRNLHSFWDGLPGPDPASADTVNRRATEIRALNRNISTSITAIAWAQEAAEIAETQLYTFGLGSGTPIRPIRLTVTYRESAKRLSDNQLSVAGARLAGLLSQQLR